MYQIFKIITLLFMSTNSLARLLTDNKKCCLDNKCIKENEWLDKCYKSCQCICQYDNCDFNCEYKKCCWNDNCVSKDEWIIQDTLKCKCGNNYKWVDCYDSKCNKNESTWTTDYTTEPIWTTNYTTEPTWTDTESSTKCCWNGDCVIENEWLTGDTLKCKCNWDGKWVECKDIP